MKLFGIVVLTLALTNVANSQSNNKSFPTGTVFDANGAVVAKAKVTAVNSKGENFETRTNEDGVYSLQLVFSKYDTNSSTTFKEAKYDIFVDSPGFVRSITKGFVFVTAYTGKMQLDIALEIRPCDDCHWIVGDPVNQIKKPLL